MEMDVVLRVMLERVRLLPTTAPDEPWSFAGVVWSAGEGGKAADAAGSSRARRAGAGGRSPLGVVPDHVVPV